MNLLFAGEVYEIIAQSGGLVFSYCKDMLETGIRIGYKMISFDTLAVTDIPKNVYQLSKFGSEYRSIASLCSNYVSARSIVLPTGNSFVVEDTGRAMLFDADGAPIWTGEILYKGSAPSDIVMHKNALWACFSSHNVLLRFNISTMREELRIGGNSSPFKNPCGLFDNGEEVVVSNKGSNKLIKANLETYAVSEYKEFTEEVFDYLKVNQKEYVLMKSGIYTL